MRNNKRMPRGRSSSSSSIGARRRTGRPLPPRTRKRSSSSRDSRPSPPRRPPPPRRRSPPRRPKSPPRAHAIRKKSVSPSSNSDHSSSVSSSSRSRSSSHSSSDSSSRSRSPVKKIEKAKIRTPPKSRPSQIKAERKSPRKSPRKIQSRVSPKVRDRSPPQKPRIAEKPSRRSPVSRFHDRRSRSRSDPRKMAPRRDRDRQSPPKEIKKIEHAVKDVRIEREVSVEKSPILHVTQISRNVNEKHLFEIFQVYGKISSIELPMMEGFEIPKGWARIEYEKFDNAQKAKEYMDGGQIDGQTVVIEMKNGAVKRKRSVSIEKNRVKRISRSNSPARRRKSPSPVNRRR